MKTLRALSSVGRASALQAECRRFDPVSAHHKFFKFKKLNTLIYLVFFAFLLFLFFIYLFYLFWLTLSFPYLIFEFRFYYFKLLLLAGLNKAATLESNSSFLNQD